MTDVCEQFNILRAKGEKIFTRLRALPPVGAYWEPFFEKAFNTYSKLWKMQQIYREKLQTGVGLKRWEIGELAARIAQLYYTYYLHTSDVNYLREAYNFYSAIRARNYFKLDQTSSPQVTPRSSSVILMRNLRYHARFVLVCLLLEIEDEVLDPIVADLSLLVMKYKAECHPTHAETKQWQSLLEEVKAYQQWRAPIGLRDDTGKVTHVLAGGRLEHIAQPADSATSPLVIGIPSLNSPTTIPVSILSKLEDDKRFSLQAAILVGNTRNQIKYSELTLNTTLMMHSLEISAAAQVASPNIAVPAHPQKFILYEASPMQVMNHLACLGSTLPLNKGLMLYISADGDASGAGFRLAADVGRAQSSDSTTLTPQDLLPFTRVPLFIVADGDNSQCLYNMDLRFGEKFLCLMSPTKWVSSASAPVPQGLFTLFLHAPLTAFCLLCGLTNVDASSYKDAENILNEFLNRVVDAQAPLLPGGVEHLMGDLYVKTLVSRFLFAHATLSQYAPAARKGLEYLPLAKPSLDSLLKSVHLRNLVLRVASILGVTELFTTEDDSDDCPLIAARPVPQSTMSPLIKAAPIPIAGSSDDI